MLHRAFIYTHICTNSSSVRILLEIKNAFQQNRLDSYNFQQISIFNSCSIRLLYMLYKEKLCDTLNINGFSSVDCVRVLKAYFFQFQGFSQYCVLYWTLYGHSAKFISARIKSCHEQVSSRNSFRVCRKINWSCGIIYLLLRFSFIIDDIKKTNNHMNKNAYIL